MGTEENKMLVRRLYEEAVNGGNLDLADEFIAADAIEHEKGIASDGRESFKQFVTVFRAAFPDLRLTIEDMIAEGDKVVCRITITGTHTGDSEFMGVAPSGKPIELETIDILRFDNGKMVEHWGRTDLLCMLQQLGKVPNDILTQKLASSSAP